MFHEQIFGDPDAADIVFTSGSDILAVGINVTHQVVLTGMRAQLGLMLRLIECFRTLLNVESTDNVMK